MSENEKTTQKKGTAVFFSFRVCLPGKFPLPWNGSLITAAHCTTNMYFANEKHPPWRLHRAQEVRQREKHTSTGDTQNWVPILTSSLPKMCGLGEEVTSFF